MEAGGRRYVIHQKKSDVFTIWNLADLHLGNKACSVDTLRADIAEIKADPFALWFGGGDYAEFIGRNDKRFNPDDLDPELFDSPEKIGEIGRTLCEAIKKLLMPIRDKCLGLVFGNHEAKYATQHDAIRMHHWLCEEMRVPDLGYTALVDTVFCRTSAVKKPKMTVERPPRLDEGGEYNCAGLIVRHFITHGAGAAQTPGGKINRLVKYMHSFEADIYWCGHVHDHTSKRIARIGANQPCNVLLEKQMLGVIAGSYLKTYSQSSTSYGERAGYSPTILGAAKVQVQPHARRSVGGKEVEAPVFWSEV